MEAQTYIAHTSQITALFCTLADFFSKEKLATLSI